MKKLIISLFVTVLLSTSLVGQDLSDVKEKIKEMNNTFAEMMIKNDHTGMLQYYTDDCISLPSYQPMLRGVEAIKKAGEMQEQSGVKILAFTLETSDLFAAGDYYIEVGTYTISMEIPGMDMPWDDKGKYVDIWQVFEDGSMKLKIDTWNTDTNPWMDMQKKDEEEKKQMMEKLESHDNE